MSRPRKKDKHLPPGVYFKHGAHYLVRAGKWHPLGKDLAPALAEYARRAQAPTGSCDTLIDEAFAVMKPRLAANTVHQYAIVAKKLKAILAEFSPDQVRAKHAAAIKLAGAKTPNMTNRLLSFARQVFHHALEQQLVEQNPFIGIRRHAEQKRGRLLTRDEWTRIYASAGPRLQVVMDLLYLTGQRIGDVLAIKRANLGDEGILFVQQKTGARLVVRWTTELRGAVARAEVLHGNVRAFTLLHNRRGKPPDYRTVKDQWDVACKAAGVPDAHLHDIRAMSLTDAKRQGKNATALAGHANAAQTDRYIRDHEIPLVDGPSIGRPKDNAA